MISSFAIPKPIADLQLWDNDYDGRGGAVLGSLALDTYIILPQEKKEVVRHILEDLQSGRSADIIHQSLLQKGYDVDVHSFLQLLCNKQLVSDGSDTRKKQSEPKKPWGSHELLRVTIKNNRLSPKQARAVMIGGVGVFCLTLAIAILSLPRMDVVATAKAYFRLTLGSGLSVAALAGQILTAIGIFFLSVTTHELGHVLAARTFGIFLRSIRLRVVWFVQPTISVQLPGLYTIAPKKRQIVALAGPVANILLASTALAVAGLTVAFPAISLPLIALTVLNVGLAVLNCNPLMPASDGYHFFSSRFFRSPDIQAAFLSQIQKTGWRSMPRKLRAYAFLYFAGGLFGLYFSNVSLYITFHLLALPAPWGLVLQVIAQAVSSLFLVRATIKPLRAG